MTLSFKGIADEAISKLPSLFGQNPHTEPDSGSSLHFQSVTQDVPHTHMEELRQGHIPQEKVPWVWATWSCSLLMYSDLLMLDPKWVMSLLWIVAGSSEVVALTGTKT